MTFLSVALISALLAVPTPSVHAALESSRPVAGEVVADPLEAVVLRFTEAVQVSPSAVVLVDDAGIRRELSIDAPSASAVELSAALPADLPPGDYRIEWRTLSTDGHVVEGDFGFSYQPPTAANSQEEQPAESTAEAANGEMEMDGGMGGMDADPEIDVPAFAALLRGMGAGLLTALAGLLVYLAWLTPRAGARIERLTGILAFVTPVVLLSHAVSWALYARGGFDMPITDFLFYVTPGQVELLRTGLAVLCLVAVLFRRWGVAALFAALALVASGFMGHSMSFVPALLVPARAIHIAALAIWLGGLLILLRSTQPGAEFQVSAERVSTLALSAVVLMLLTGLTHVIAFPTPLLELATSFYGALLLAKLFGMAVLIAMGARNRFRVMPRLPEADAIASLRKAVAWEIGVMAAILLVTGVLAYVPVPEVMDVAIGGIGAK